MASEWRYRGRVVTADDVTSIRQLIAENPGASRRRLSEKLCEAWQWKQANGALRDMVCRGLLLMLHRAGEIELPPIRFQTLNPFVRRAHSRADADRHDADRQCTQATPTNRAATGAANGRRATVQQSDGAASLLKVRTTSGFCDILLHLINYLKTLIAAHQRIEFARGEFGS